MVGSDQRSRILSSQIRDFKCRKICLLAPSTPLLSCRSTNENIWCMPNQLFSNLIISEVNSEPGSEIRQSNFAKYTQCRKIAVAALTALCSFTGYIKTCFVKWSLVASDIPLFVLFKTQVIDTNHGDLSSWGVEHGELKRIPSPNELFDTPGSH